MSGGLQVLMATNRIDILDPALLRPGRIDRKIEFPNPNESSRADILRIHSRKMNLVRGIDLRKIADKMTGASGAELKVLIRSATHYGQAPSSKSMLSSRHSTSARRQLQKACAVAHAFLRLSLRGTKQALHIFTPGSCVGVDINTCLICRRAARRLACLLSGNGGCMSLR